jgi:hypothetical protein
MVIRYYGSKDGLFAAVATLDFKAALLTALPRCGFGEALVRHVLNRWDDPKDDAALAAMMRASTSNEAGFWVHTGNERACIEGLCQRVLGS